ncbi:MAG: SAM-dependent methyltransferase [Proteobacteria bacterium]|nr:SAM-dependent methyltransferase [Pseudomonadota bacterium]
MPDKRPAPQPSGTAVFTTLTRALAYREFNYGILGNDSLAESFLPFYLKVLLKAKLFRTRIKHKIPPGMYQYMLARTAYFDAVFKDALNRNVPQIVLLGAGYDTRAYRFADLIRDTKIFELDAPPTQNSKRSRLFKSHITIPDNAVFIPIDFDAESLQDALGKAGYDEHKNTLFLMEGVSYYIEPESVDATLKFVSSNLKAESTIVFDYILPVPIEKLDDYYGARALHEHHLKNHPNEKGKFFIEEEAVAAYLEQRGLRVVEHLDSSGMENRYLINKDGLSIGQVTGWFRIVLAASRCNSADLL